MAVKNSLWSRRILALFAVGPLLVPIFSSKTWAARHHILALGLIIAYEILLFVTGFFGHVLGNLRRQWADRLSEHIDQAATRRFSRFESRYTEYVRQTHRFIDQKGLATLGERTPELDDVFVDVSLASRAPHQVSGAVLSEPPSDITDRRSIWDFLKSKSGPPVVLAVIGAPGSGKTTLLRHTASKLTHLTRYRGIPVLLMLRESAATITSHPDITLPDVIIAQVEPLLSPVPTGWFQQRLATGRCVVMFDGLDEVAMQEHRQLVVDWVDRQIARYPENDYLITSRPHGYQEYPLERATVLQVRRFTEKQISKFVSGWYLAAERYSAGSSDEFVEGRALAEADDLLARLNETPALADLASNPLLLTMITNVHRYRGALPGTRAELYAEVCLVLLGRRQQAKKLIDPLRIDQKEVVLRELAFKMMTDRVRDLPSDRVANIIGQVLPHVSASLTAAEFLADIRANGLLLEREHGMYSFAHHTFQEYLAAAHIRERGQLRVLIDNVGDSWWRETTLLYVARGNAGPIVEACLRSERIPALTLAFDCADAASELTPQLRRHLDALLAEASNPQAPEERRNLAAAVIASRELRATFRLEDGAQACAAPVSDNLYRLFEEHRINEAYRHSSTNVPQDMSADSVAGINVTDPSRFVTWLNHLLEADAIYRLPNAAEVKDPAYSNNPAFMQRCIWFASTNAPGQVDLWARQGVRHPYSISFQKFIEQVRVDSVGPIGLATTYNLALYLLYVLKLARELASPDPELSQALGLGVTFCSEVVNEIAIEFGQSYRLGMEMETGSAHESARRPGAPAAHEGLGAILVLIFALHQALDRQLHLDFLPSQISKVKPIRLQGTVLNAASSRAPVLRRAMDKVRKVALNYSDLAVDMIRQNPDLDMNLDYALDGCHASKLCSELDRYLEEVRALGSSFGSDIDLTVTPEAGLGMWMLLGRASSTFGSSRKIVSTVSIETAYAGNQEIAVVPQALQEVMVSAMRELKEYFEASSDDLLTVRIIPAAGVLHGLLTMLASGDRSHLQYAPFARLSAIAIAETLQSIEYDEALVQRFVHVAVGITALEYSVSQASRHNDAIGLIFA